MAEGYHVLFRENKKDTWGPIHSDTFKTKKEAQKFLSGMKKQAKEEGYTKEEFKISEGAPPVPAKRGFFRGNQLLNFVAVGVAATAIYLIVRD